MIPDHILSSRAVYAPFLDPVNSQDNLLADFEMGGVGLNDPSQGLRVKLWTLTMVGDDVTVSAEGVAPVVLFTRPLITEISLAFDQNMRPFVAFVEDELARFWWFDTVAGMAVFTDLPDAVTPRATLDDKRETQLVNSDIILAYVKTNNLYFRAQRDRYTVEYLLREGIGGILISIGMDKGNRLRFKLKSTLGL